MAILEDEMELEFTPEQLKQVQNVVDAAKSLRDAMVELFRQVMDALHKAFEVLMRLFAKLQILEWRMPYWLAEFVSQNMPTWMAYKMGVHWWRNRYSVLTK